MSDYYGNVDFFPINGDTALTYIKEEDVLLIATVDDSLNLDYGYTRLNYLGFTRKLRTRDLIRVTPVNFPPIGADYYYRNVNVSPDQGDLIITSDELGVQYLDRLGIVHQVYLADDTLTYRDIEGGLHNVEIKECCGLAKGLGRAERCKSLLLDNLTKG